jgi:hypothetical protein
MNEKSVKNLKTALVRSRPGPGNKRRALYYDAFFADPEAVEDDYRRLKRIEG